jgi:hypothetical protein
VKHKALIAFIMDVTNMGSPREAHKMLVSRTIPSLTHIIKAIPKESASSRGVEDARRPCPIITWLSCVGESILELSIPIPDLDHLATSFDLAPKFGVLGLHSNICVVDKELFGSWDAVAFNLIMFLKLKKNACLLGACR